MDKETKQEQAPKEATLEQSPEHEGQTTVNVFVLTGDGLAYYNLPRDEDQLIKSLDLESDLQQAPKSEEAAPKSEEAAPKKGSVTPAPTLVVHYRDYSDDNDSSSSHKISVDKGQVKVTATDVAPKPERPAAETVYCRGYLDEHGTLCCERFFPGKEQTKVAPSESEQGPVEPEETTNDIEARDTVPRRLVTPDISNNPPRIAQPDIERWNTVICHSPDPMKQHSIEDDDVTRDNDPGVTRNIYFPQDNCSDASGDYYDATLDEEEEQYEEEAKQTEEPSNKLVFEERSKSGMTETDDWKELVAVAILNLGAEILVPGSFEYERLVDESKEFRDKRNNQELLFLMSRIVTEKAVTYGTHIDRRFAALCHFMLMGMGK